MKRRLPRLLSLTLCISMVMACFVFPTAVSATQNGATVIVDNADTTQTSSSGTWTASTTKTGYYGGNYVSNPGATNAWFQWQPNLAQAGWYQVYCMLPNVAESDASISNKAVYTVTDSTGSKTVTVNQRKAGGSWEYMGTFQFNAGSAGTVKLAGNSTGSIMADAMMFVYTESDKVLISDNKDLTVASAGSWGPGAGKQGYYGADYTSAAIDNSGGTWFQWKTPLPYDGYYRVSYHQPTVQSGDTSVSNNVPYEITDANGTEKVSANQRRAAGWYALGVYKFAAGVAKTTVYAENGSVIADAVQYEYIGTPDDSGVIVDNAQAAKVGAWTSSTFRLGYYGSDYLTTAPSGTGEKSVTWTPNIPEDGYYAVYCWYPAANLQSCSGVPYTVTDADGSTKYLVNQQTSAMQWKLLGIHRFTKGTGGNVQLVNKGNGTNPPAVLADAVRFTPLTKTYDDTTFASQGTWTTQTDASAEGGSYQVGSAGAKLTMQTPPLFSAGGYYQLQLHMPDAAQMPQGTATVTLGTNTYTVNMSSLKAGYNTIGYPKLSEGQPYSLSVEATSGTVWADAVRLAYTSYDLAYLDYEAGVQNAGWQSSTGSDWATNGTALAGTQGYTTYTDNAWTAPVLDVKLRAQSMQQNASFGVILGGQGDQTAKLTYDAGQQKFIVTDVDGSTIAQSDTIALQTGRDYDLQISMNVPDLTVKLDGTQILTGSLFRNGAVGFFTSGASLAVGHLFVKSGVGATYDSGYYNVNLNDPQQVIEGLGVEVQSDSIGSNYMSDATTSVPHDLTQPERDRLYNDMLKGFRYLRLATGLYYRGTDAQGKQLVQRWDTQNAELAELIQKSGIEGVDFEFWSPTPYFKSNNSYINGVLKCFDPSFTGNKQSFLQEFADSIKDDITYLNNNGIPVIQYGLQNEPNVTGVFYSNCVYSDQNYYDTFKVVAPTLKAAFPNLQIHADSNNGQYGRGSALIRQDPDLLKLVNAWTFHRIGVYSDDMIQQASYYNSNKGRDDIPVYNNEFEYLDNNTSDWRCINTAQSIMNWMTFENSPTWYWLHMLKPLGNAEAAGFGLGYFRGQGDTKTYGSAYDSLAQGTWDYNYQNWNAIRGFLKYMPWNSRRYSVQEDKVRYDQRIMTFKDPDGRLVIALTNRSDSDMFRFNINTGINATFKGYRYTPGSKDEIALNAQNGSTIRPVLPPLSIEFWVQDTVVKTDLQTLYDANKTKTQGNYTDTSWQAFTDALTAANTVLNDANATQAQVDSAKTNLQTAVSGLAEKPPVDKVALQMLYDANKTKPQGNYTDASWQSFTAALAAASTVLNDADATQAQVDSAKTALQTAVSGLVEQEQPPVVDKTALQTLYDANKTKTQGNYTDTSWQSFTDALTASNTVLNAADATQAQVDTAKTTLQAAVSGLKEKQTENPGSSAPGSVSQPASSTAGSQSSDSSGAVSHASDSPDTGSRSPVGAAGVVALLLAGAAAVVLGKTKIKRA